MLQSEILSFAERLIPVYGCADFDLVLSQITEDAPPSAKILVKMELNRLMAPCKKSVDLRGHVDGECKKYVFDGIAHWLDDIAFNAYHKNIRKFGSYTEGVWEALIITPNNAREMNKRSSAAQSNAFTSSESPFLAEPIQLGYELKRQEKRLKVQSQVDIRRSKGEQLYGLSIDLSRTGAKFKVPSAYKYNLGETIKVTFTEFASKLPLADIDKPLAYRVLAVDDCYDNDSVRYLRTTLISDAKVIERVIDEVLSNTTKRNRHDNQDKVLLTRARGYEHIALKHTSSLPLFFKGSELKLAMLTPNNHHLWQYWHDERNQPVFDSLLHQERMASLIASGVNNTTNVLYSFTHVHDGKTYFYSMLRPEATREQRQLFWHVGAKRSSWRVFRISIFKLSELEKNELTALSTEVASITHMGLLHEISDEQSGQDYLLAEKPRLPPNTLNAFRHPRRTFSNPKGLYFDTQSRRKEPRYSFKTPIELTAAQSKVSGHSIDISKRGLEVTLEHPTSLRSGQMVQIHFRELQLYDKNLALSAVPYRVVRVGTDGQRVQLVIDESSKTLRVIAFFNKIIEHNQDKLVEQQEVLPSDAVLERLHSVLLSRTSNASIYISKTSAGSFRTPVIGVNTPLAKHIEPFAQLGYKQMFSLEPLFKGRTNSLISEPVKRLVHTKKKHQDIYLSVSKIGNIINGIESRLPQDFNSIKARIHFIKRARMMGDFYALRVSTVPVFDPMTSLLRKDISKLTQLSVHQSRKLEKELNAIIGYCEFEDITEEILVRLDLTD